jgi:hypothetical protein
MLLVIFINYINANSLILDLFTFENVEFMILIELLMLFLLTRIISLLKDMFVIMIFYRIN